MAARLLGYMTGARKPTSSYLTSEAFLEVKESKRDSKEYTALYGKDPAVSVYTRDNKKLAEQKKFKTQFLKLIDNFKIWGDDHKCNNPEILSSLANLKSVFFQPVYAESQSDSYFTLVKKGLEGVFFQLTNESMPLQKRIDTYKNLCSTLDVCAPGINLHIQDAYIALNPQDSVEWWLASLRNAIVNQYASFHSNLLGIHPDNQVHTNIAFGKCARELGWNPLFSVDNIIDHFAVTAGVEKEDIAVFYDYFFGEYTVDRIIGCMRSAIHERIKQLTVKHDVIVHNGWFKYSFPFVSEFQQFLETLGLAKIGRDELNALHIFHHATHGEEAWIKIKFNEILRELIYNKNLFALFPHWDLISAEQGLVEISSIITAYSLHTFYDLLDHDMIPDHIMQELAVNGSWLGRILSVITNRKNWDHLLQTIEDLEEQGRIRKGAPDKQYEQQKKLMMIFSLQNWGEVDHLVFKGAALRNAVKSGDFVTVKKFFSHEQLRHPSFQLRRELLKIAIENNRSMMIIFLLSNSLDAELELLSAATDSLKLAYNIINNRLFREIMSSIMPVDVRFGEDQEFYQFIDVCKNFIFLIEKTYQDRKLMMACDERLRELDEDVQRYNAKRFTEKYVDKQKASAVSRKVPYLHWINTIDDVLLDCARKGNQFDLEMAIDYGATKFADALGIAAKIGNSKITKILLKHQNRNNSIPLEDKKSEPAPFSWKKKSIQQLHLFGSSSLGSLEYVSCVDESKIQSVKICQAMNGNGEAEIMLFWKNNISNEQMNLFLLKNGYPMSSYANACCYSLFLYNKHFLQVFLAKLKKFDPLTSEIEANLISASQYFKQTSDPQLLGWIQEGDFLFSTNANKRRHIIYRSCQEESSINSLILENDPLKNQVRLIISVKRDKTKKFMSVLELSPFQSLSSPSISCTHLSYTLTNLQHLEGLLKVLQKADANVATIIASVIENYQTIHMPEKQINKTPDFSHL